MKLDLRNAYNEVKRETILRRLEECPYLQQLAPLFWATHEVRSPIYVAHDGLVRTEFDSAEGVQQGDGISSAAFCTAIHPEVLALDT